MWHFEKISLFFGHTMVHTVLFWALMTFIVWTKTVEWMEPMILVLLLPLLFEFQQQCATSCQFLTFRFCHNSLDSFHWSSIPWLITVYYRSVTIHRYGSIYRYDASMPRVKYRYLSYKKAPLFWHCPHFLIMSVYTWPPMRAFSFNLTCQAGLYIRTARRHKASI